MKFVSQVFVIMFLLISISISASSDTQVCAYLFYGEGCPHCASVEHYLNSIESSDSNVEIIRFEIYKNRSNLILLRDYFDAYGINQDARGVPALFISNISLVGDKAIKGNLESIIAKGSQACPTIVAKNTSSVTNGTSAFDQYSELSMITIIGAALVDSINPCAIAVLLILLGALLSSGDRMKALKAGFAFTLSIYLAYFLFGLGLISVLQFSGISYWLSGIIGLFAIVVGLLNIKDYFWYGGGGFVMEIPRSWRPKLKSILGSVTSPLGAFLMGFIVCLFELPCTGGPYLFVLGLLAERSTALSSIPILLIYNLFFVLPLILITLLIYFGFSNVEKANEWKDKNIRILHLVAGLIMLVLGGIVLLDLI